MKKNISLILFLLSFYILLSIFPHQGPNFGGDVGEELQRFLYKFTGVLFPYFLSFFLFILAFYLYKELRNIKLLITGTLYLVFFPLFVYLLPIDINRGKVFELLVQFLNKNLGNIFPKIAVFIILVIAVLPFVKEKKLKILSIRDRFLFRKKEKKVKKDKVFLKPVKKRGEKSKKKEEKKTKEFRIDKKRLLGIFKKSEFTQKINKRELEDKGNQIKEKLMEFGIKGEIKEIHSGPFVTLFEFEPEKGIQIKRIKNLSEDLALRLKSSRIRVVAPIPDKGTVGIEIPNKKISTLRIGNIFENTEFLFDDKPLGFVLGVTTDGTPYYTDLAKMPHLLIAGATGSGKSVCISSIITSLSLKSSPDRVRFILIDPKRIELSRFEGLPHLLAPCIINRKDSVNILLMAIKWMEERYKLLAREGARDIESYNKKSKNKMPYIVIIIDEFADLMFTERTKIEYSIARLAQMARAVGIHLIIATQRPSVDIITGTIKANFPVRIAFRLPSITDSRTILDQPGAEKLLGRGDMLFIPPGKAEPIRLHAPFVSDEEVNEFVRTYAIPYFHQKLEEVFEREFKREEVVEMFERGFLPFISGQSSGELSYIKEQIIEFFSKYEEDYQNLDKKLGYIRDNYYGKLPEITFELPEEDKKIGYLGDKEYDSLLKEAAYIVVSSKTASATLLQRKLNIGFPRAAKIIDQLEEMGIVGPSEGSKPRKVLVSVQDLEDIFS